MYRKESQEKNKKKDSCKEAGLQLKLHQCSHSKTRKTEEKQRKYVNAFTKIMKRKKLKYFVY